VANKDAKKWQETYGEALTIPSGALDAFDEFPSLSINDYAAFLEAQGNEAAPFVKKVALELRWTYDMWKKAQRDADKSQLMQAIYNDASGPEWNFVRRFLIDWAKNNNVGLRP
jgi:hypothetical protein